VQVVEAMSKLVNYIKESYNELVYKVAWPSWKELQNSAIVVFVASLIIAAIIALMDITFKNLMHIIYSLFY
jgi:preprotein translocase subunit SecE